MRYKNIILTAVFFFSSLNCFSQQRYSDYPITMVDIKKIELTDNFWLPKIQTVQKITIAHGFEKCEVEGRLDNFLIAGKKKTGTVCGKMPFDDTDVYKIIEGASYSLINAPNKELDSYLDSVIEIIRIGQEPDGYLTTWFTIDSTNPPAPWVPKEGARWSREQSSHELYNSGHLFEAAAAHYTATGKRTLLDVAIKNADLLVQNFGPGKLTIPPGHQIVETGLIKLYRITGNVQYLQLAKNFLDWRGDSSTHKLYGEYSQDHKPVTQQDEIVGHAVRAVYMYAGMTDIAAIYNDEAYLDAVMKIWNSMVERKMYVTGGIGARHESESVGNDYELPNLTAYCETCASIGNVYWNTRLFMLTGDGKYFDVIERILYNALIAGISLDGKSFFYVNPLECDGVFEFNSGSLTRQPWFDCSCCPTNLIRFIPAMPGLLYGVHDDTLFVNLYASNNAEVNVGNSVVRIEESSEYPWNGKTILKIIPSKKTRFTVKLRIPGWAQNQVLPGNLYSYTDTIQNKISILVNGKEISYDIDRGYAVISRTWSKNETIEMNMPMNIRRVISNENVKSNKNLVALERVPFVYCVEGIDNANRLNDILLSDDVVLKVEKKNELLDGINVLTGIVNVRSGEGTMELFAIPYYAWANRGITTMKVWLPRKCMDDR
jgi:DUF1680 family protein